MQAVKSRAPQRAAGALAQAARPCIRASCQKHEPTLRTSTALQSPSEGSVMLKFLYPPATRRYINTFSRNQRIPSNITATGRQYSTASESESGPEPPSGSSEDAKTDTEADPLSYLLGEASPEEEESLKPRRKVPLFPPTPEYAASQRPHVRRASRGNDFFGGRYNGDDIADDASMASGGSRSKLTERERVIFERIFDKLLHQQGTGTGGVSQQVRGRAAKPSPVISALFESAVGPQRSGDEVSFGPERTGDDDKGSMQAVLSRGDFPASLRYAAAGAMGLSRKDVGLESDENSKERLEEYRKLKVILDNCQNDLEIWEFLDNHVFSMALTNSDGLKSLDATSTVENEKKLDKAKTSKLVGMNDAAVPSSNYPKLLHNAIFTLRTAYRDFPACIAVFERIKSLGAESYIIGCSIAVYNEMLLVRWKGYRDIQSFVDLLEEMRLNGVQANVQTAEIVTDVLNDIRVFENDSFLPGGTLMWQNGDVLDGKAKLKRMLRSLVDETNERGEHRALQA